MVVIDIEVMSTMETIRAEEALIWKLLNVK